MLLSPLGGLGARRLSVHLQLQPEHKIFKHSSNEAIKRQSDEGIKQWSDETMKP